MSCPAHALAESRKEIDIETVDLIRELAADLPTSGVVVDLGTGSGTALLSVLAERNDAIHIHSYDLDVQWGQMVVKNEKVQRVGDVTFYRGDILTPDGVPLRAKEGIDLLLVDLLPERTEDILARWLPLLNPGARVWVHNADHAHAKAVINAIVNESDFPIDTVEIRGKSWVGVAAKDSMWAENASVPDSEITFQKVEDRVADESPPDPSITDDESGPDPKTGVESADPREEVQSSQSTTEDEAQTSEPPSRPKRAPSKRRSRKKPTE